MSTVSRAHTDGTEPRPVAQPHPSTDPTRLPPGFDLHDVSDCPVGHRCESCGTDNGTLAVETATLPRLGVMCLTVCHRCAAFDQDYPITVATANRLVLQHAVHLGIDVDQMIAAMRQAEQ